MTKFGPKLFASIAINALIKHCYCEHKNHLTNMSFKAYLRQNIYTMSLLSKQDIFDKLTAMIIRSPPKKQTMSKSSKPHQHVVPKHIEGKILIQQCHY